MRGAIDGPGCGYALAPLAKLIHKRVPIDSTVQWKLTLHLQLLGKEIWSTRLEHLEASLLEREPNKRHLGGNRE
jgi:hypothetical protein